jgi:DNA-binding NtrC family response regulator
MGLPIQLPPLRERGNDILLLARSFADEFCRENGLQAKSISPGAKNLLLNYPFPGNIRELKAIMELACVLSSGETIESEHLNLNGRDSMSNILAKEKTLDEYTREIIGYFLSRYNQNVKEVASRLNIGKSTIYRYLQAKNPKTD